MTEAAAQRASPWVPLLGALPARSPTPRLLDIDAARGLAIVLVVVGHVVAREMPADNHWYAVLKELIYRFHMPLFMLLAGISFGLSLPGFPTWGSVARYSWTKTGRLIVPYLIFGIVILVGKLGAARFLHVDNPPRGSLDDLWMLVVRPTESAAGFLWFIYVLGLYYLVLPSLLRLLGRRPIALMVLALAAQAFAWPRELLLSEAVAYLPYFTAGIMLWSVRKEWEAIDWKAVAVSVSAFAVVLVLALPLGLSKWLVGAVSVPATLALAQRVPPALAGWMAYLGRMSFPIYLMNTLAIGVAKGLLLKAMPWDGLNFLIFFPVLAVAGLAVPVLVKRWVARRAPAIDRYL